jgi:cobalt-zinc-cadmium efflux system membrane fusion protein
VKRGARGVSLAAFLLAAGASAAFLAARPQQPNRTRPGGVASLPDAEKGEKIRRVGRDGVIVPAGVAQNMGLRTVEISDQARPVRLPPLQGTLAVDSDHLARVRARFAGEVVLIGSETGTAATSVLNSFAPAHPRVGDTVRKGELLAVVWSKDLGEKKSELVDAVSKLRSDDAVLRRLRDGQTDGSIPARSVWDAERAVESDRVAVARAERTLRAWRLTDDEIASVRAEADWLSTPNATLDTRRADQTQWARVEVRSPMDGVILQRDVTVGDIVDTTTDLFKVGDLSHLVVWAHLYEEDLPLLQTLPRPVRWKVALPSRPGVVFPGTLDQIAAVIDPNQHTALVTGRVENPDGHLRAGQFVTVSVDLPPPPGEIEVPADAVLEDGRESVVFVQPDPAKLRFVRIPIRVTRRFRDAVCVRAGEGLKPGDQVVTGGAILLRDATDTLPAPKG